ncbi:MAG: hypothetical protein R3F37_14695 [Candidatus Competibacteraceae bacterium]
MTRLPDWMQTEEMQRSDERCKPFEQERAYHRYQARLDYLRMKSIENYEDLARRNRAGAGGGSGRGRREEAGAGGGRAGAGGGRAGAGSPESRRGRRRRAGAGGGRAGAGGGNS